MPRLFIPLYFLLPACAASDLDLNRCEQLSGAAIAHTFAGVVDTAIVKDLEHGRATNHWYDDGRFTSEWSSKDSGGVVSGTWHVEGDQRCVVVASGLADRNEHKTCSPLYQCRDNIVSVNADGSVHGVHHVEGL
ncbi:MAG: hypothetical protein OEQ90_10780 [Gammaproteobacteria bacterium]|nr:hypothetical protein [Gammaproteobacteria bacterium]